MKINSKRQGSIVAIYVITALVYTALFIAIPFRKTPVLWLTFTASLLSFVIGFVACIVGYGKDYTLTSKFFGYPVYRIGIIYTIAQTVSSVIICIIGAMVNVPMWVGLVISIVFLGVALIGIIITDNIRDYIEQEDIREQEATDNMIAIIENVTAIRDSCEEETLRTELNILLEKMRHSDPVTSSQTRMKEIEIMGEVDKLRGMIDSESLVQTKKQIAFISQQLSARNRICINSKR